MSDRPYETKLGVAVVEATEPNASAIAEADQRTNQQVVLVAELHHRIQNTLVIVLALCRLTARTVSTLEEFEAAFSERIQAMARTNALLLQGNVQAVDIQTALEVELEPYLDDKGQVTLECEPLHVSPEAALNLSLIFHELVINAVKYGALSQPAGRLLVTCRRQGQLAMIEWAETTPNLTERPITEGSGSMLIKRLTKALGGHSSLQILPKGLNAQLSFALNPR